MDTDRHASEDDERQDIPSPRTPGSPHEYGYGDGSTSPADAASPAGAPLAETGASTEETRPATAPRAVLRPVPEGFPTPPPRPAVPNRRPARRPDPASAPARPRRLLIGGLAAAAVLLLAVMIGGGTLVYRALSPTEADPAVSATPSAPAESEEPSAVSTGGVLVTEVSTEVGVRAVGAPSGRLEPEGEFVIVVFEVQNDSEDAVIIEASAVLESADGTHPLDPEATRTHETDSPSVGLVGAGATKRFHAVFDVPIGTDPTSLILELGTLDETVTLPLAG